MKQKILPLFLISLCSHADTLSEIRGCYDKAAATVEMRACLDKELDFYDVQLNSSYKKLQTVLEPQEVDNLIKAQRAWLDFRTAECAFAAARDLQGTIGPLSTGDCVVTMTKNRIKELDNYTAQFKS